MINITLGVVLGSPNMKYPKNWFKIINITQIPEMNPARGFCFIVHCTRHLIQAEAQENGWKIEV